MSLISTRYFDPQKVVRITPSVMNLKIFHKNCQADIFAWTKHLLQLHKGATNKCNSKECNNNRECSAECNNKECSNNRECNDKECNAECIERESTKTLILYDRSNSTICVIPQTQLECDDSTECSEAECTCTECYNNRHKDDNNSQRNNDNGMDDLDSGIKPHLVRRNLLVLTFVFLFQFIAYDGLAALQVSYRCHFFIFSFKYMII